MKPWLGIYSCMAQDDDFDWGELGREWWLATATTCGATEKHAKFAARKHAGATNAAAARSAGFGAGNDASARSEGYRVSRSNKILSLLALAVAKAGGGCDGLLTPEEARRILTGLARGSDPALKIKSIETLNRLDKDELAARSKDDGPSDPVDTVRAIIISIPYAGVAMAAGVWASEFGGLESFPYLKECAPLLVRDFAADWARWRGQRPNPQLDEMAAGRILSPDELVKALTSAAAAVVRSRSSLEREPEPAVETNGAEVINDAA
jgi:hypothetical protein